MGRLTVSLRPESSAKQEKPQSRQQTVVSSEIMASPARSFARLASVGRRGANSMVVMATIAGLELDEDRLRQHDGEEPAGWRHRGGFEVDLTAPTHRSVAQSRAESVVV